jgi:hypothetical protein
VGPLAHRRGFFATFAPAGPDPAIAIVSAALSVLLPACSHFLRLPWHRLRIALSSVTLMTEVRLVGAREKGRRPGGGHTPPRAA